MAEDSTRYFCLAGEELASFGPDTIIEYKVREEYRRDQLMAQSKKRKKRSFSEDSSTTISVRFRTTHGNRVLLYATNGLDHIMIHVRIHIKLPKKSEILVLSALFCHNYRKGEY